MIGYANLKRVAIQTTNDVVKARLDDELTKKNIDTAVQEALREHATQQIDDAIRAEIKNAVAEQVARQAPEQRNLTIALTAKAVEELRPQIQAFARDQTRNLIAEANKPRILQTSAQEALTSCAKSVGPIHATIGSGGDAEAQNYLAQISSSMEAGGWIVERYALLQARLDLPRYGLALVTTPKDAKSSEVSQIAGCLQKSQIPVQLIVSAHESEWGNVTMILVLPKAR